MFVDTPIEDVREARPEGAVQEGPGRRAQGFTGIDDPYETPEQADVVIAGDRTPAEEAAAAIVEVL